MPLHRSNSVDDSIRQIWEIVDTPLDRPVRQRRIPAPVIGVALGFVLIAAVVVSTSLFRDERTKALATVESRTDDAPDTRASVRSSVVVQTTAQPSKSLSVRAIQTTPVVHRDAHPMRTMPNDRAVRFDLPTFAALEPVESPVIALDPIEPGAEVFEPEALASAFITTPIGASGSWGTIVAVPDAGSPKQPKRTRLKQIGPGRWIALPNEPPSPEVQPALNVSNSPSSTQGVASSLGAGTVVVVEEQTSIPREGRTDARVPLLPMPNFEQLSAVGGVSRDR